jgi:hypothetical protein
MVRLSLESSRFFEKKRRKKLLLVWRRAVAPPLAQIHKSLFGSPGGQNFSTEKEHLPKSIWPEA